ncbi:1-acyl-sn-glycerol-3-phosphate acyltransferase [Candidatus Saccharibacteria bacterium]|nr:1-acyl-sn-glycerol-3-phosphate acyltransferase [Candidatus Saccharibacteria bacterium]
MKKYIIRSFQLFILLVIRLMFIGRVKIVIAPASSKISGPVVIAANHASGFDPFVLGCFLPVKTFLRVFPFSFMTANIFYHRLWKPLAWLAGCYPAKQASERNPKHSYGVGYSIKSFYEGFSVMMFPEGKRTKSPHEAKPGVSWILNETKASLLLCHIEWSSSGWLKTANIGYKMAGKHEAASPEAIMKAVYNLPVEHKVMLAENEA